MHSWKSQAELNFTANELRPLNSPELNSPDYYVRENIPGDRNAAGECLTQDTIDRDVKEF